MPLLCRVSRLKQTVGQRIDETLCVHTYIFVQTKKGHGGPLWTVAVRIYAGTQ